MKQKELESLAARMVSGPRDPYLYERAQEALVGTSGRAWRTLGRRGGRHPVTAKGIEPRSLHLPERAEFLVKTSKELEQPG